MHVQRESAVSHEQAYGDLRVDPALRAHPDFAELVFVLGLEIQGRQAYRTTATPGPALEAAVAPDAVCTLRICGGIHRTYRRI